MLTWLLPICVLLDVGRELCFKQCTNAIEGHAPIGPAVRTAVFSKAAISWGAVGAGVWLIEIVIYALVLTSVALNQAFPILSLTYAATPVASWLLLGEHINPRRWFGILLVTIGVATIAATGVR